MTAKRSRELLTVHEVCERLRIKPGTARKYARLGVLPAFHLSDSKHSELRFYEYGVDEFRSRARAAA